MTHFTKGEFVLEYRGELINSLESNRRHRVYHNNLKGFMFDFIWHDKFWTIDAARDDGTLGRLVNDDHINPNCKMKRIIVKGKPHLCLFALRDITPLEEATYNYGNADCPWRSKWTKYGMDTDTNRLESGGTSGDVTQCTQHSQQKSASHIHILSQN
ncbi:N-lysine methyltransferase KMT5A isoform X2 [Ictalurus punctatus]|uniref:N-lysine methyltransferase KMT5A isoform X2 n=1 Tax=Ictalurus punctatus TaxID=7998 RepID=A0A9F7TPX2_ICTPU|nr:N-lysine methyltransferase KMT5A isoform X2 [Ictalurus punctatus]